MCDEGKANVETILFSYQLKAMLVESTSDMCCRALNCLLTEKDRFRCDLSKAYVARFKLPSTPLEHDIRQRRFKSPFL